MGYHDFFVYLLELDQTPFPCYQIQEKAKLQQKEKKFKQHEWE